MATPNGDVKIETAESFAKDYLDDLFNNNKNLGAFEEETLDLNITSKYDNLEIEEEEQNQAERASAIPEPTATFSVETSPVVEESNSADEPLEPGQLTLQVNGHASESEVEVEVAAQNGALESEVLEPGRVQFTDQSSESVITEQQVSQLSIQEDAPLEPGNTTFQSAEVAAEEEEDDVVTPIPMSRSKPVQTSEEEEEEEAIAQMQFQKIGLSKNWWDSKRNETEITKEPGKPVDKFRTIKQNIKRGNTRSLLERFENMSKVAE